MKRLLQPITIRNLTLKNRIVFAPASLGRDPIAFYERLAKGGCGLIVMADLSVVPSMLSAPSLDNMRWEGTFRQILDVCHQYGCKVSAQLFHPEYDIDQMSNLYMQMKAHAIQPGKGLSPKQVREAMAASTLTYCDTLTAEQIGQILKAFEAAASRAEKLGFDMIQIHGDRLTGSFTSPLFNHRTDSYGIYSSFPLELVEAVRRGAPETPVDYKLTVRTRQPAYGRGGIALEQIPEFVHILEESGIDCFHVTLANHTATGDTIPDFRHPYFQDEGCFVELAREVRRCTDKPVCCVGKIHSPEMAERLCREGMDLIGMCRQLIADPNWPAKVRDGRTEEIVSCLYCNKNCVSALKSGSPVSCILWKKEEEQNDENTK